jgi:hypothetical protein
MEIDINKLVIQSGMKMNEYGEPSFDRHYDSRTQLEALIDLVAESFRANMVQKFSSLDAPITAENVVQTIQSITVKKQ